MTSMAALIKMVEVNDYESLSNIMMNKKVELNFCKHGISLISKAVEVRSKECFDLLLNNPGYTYHKDNFWQNGVDKAMDYYKGSQNKTNEYYLIKLIEKDAECFEILGDLIQFPNIFEIYFNKVEKTDTLIDRIIEMAIITKNSEMINFGLDFALKENYNLNHNEYFKDAIKRSNLEAIQILIDRGVEWKRVNNEPSLYFAICNNYKNFNEGIINFFINKYSELSFEELNSIPNIKKMFYLWKNNFRDFKIEIVEKILKLNIHWDNLNEVLLDLVKHIVNAKPYSDSMWSVDNTVTSIEEMIQIINIIFKNLKVTSNILEILIIDDFKILDEQIKKYGDKSIRVITLAIKIYEVFYLFENYGYYLSKSLMTELYNKKIIIFSPETWLAEKEKFIKKINPPIIEKTESKKKKATKRKLKKIVINNDPDNELEL